jgi:hypothetical protein
VEASPRGGGGEGGLWPRRAQVEERSEVLAVAGRRGGQRQRLGEVHGHGAEGSGDLSGRRKDEEVSSLKRAIIDFGS